MNEQLLTILEIFKKSNITHCVDQGTLLGLYRDGSLLDSDMDIDISMFDIDLEKLKIISPDVCLHGYNGLIFKYNFIPLNKSLRKIDISIYRKKDNKYYWCPQRVSKIFDSKLLNTIIIGINKLYLQSKVYINNENKALSLISNYYTWKIPYSYFQSIKFHAGLGVFIPGQVEEHLTLHYSDWKKPQKRWNFLTQDDALILETPQNILNKDLSKL